MTQKLKYACIGAGGIARKKHLNGYSRLSEVEIVAICDICRNAAEKLASDFEVPHVYTDYLEMLEKEKPDIVSVCTPNVTHKQITIDVLNHGCHVHVEKPMALNAAEAHEILAAAKKNGKKVQVGLNKRFLSSTVLLDRLLAQKFFGDIYHVRCGWERNSGIPGVGSWFTNHAQSGGGALIDLGVHYLDLAMYIMGWPEPASVSGVLNNQFLFDSTRIRRGYHSADGPIDVEDAANGTVVMRDGQTLEYCFSWASNMEKEIRYVEVYGTKAGFRMVNDELRLFTQLGGTMFTLMPDAATMPLDENEFASFAQSIEEDREPVASAMQATKIMELIDLIYRDSVDRKQPENQRQ